MKRLLLPILLLFVASCQNKGSVFNLLENAENVRGRSLDLTRYLGRPFDTTVFGDTLLCIGDRNEGKSIAIYDLKNKEFKGNYLTEGRGPGEVLPPVLVMAFSQSDHLYLIQRSKGAVGIYNFTEQKITQEITLEGRPGDVEKMRDYYVGIGPSLEASRFGVYKDDGTTLRFEGSYPSLAKYGGGAEFYAYQGKLCANPQGNYFALGSTFCDLLDFYHVTDSETRLVRRYSQSYEPKMQYTETADFRSSFVEPDCIVSYLRTYGTAEYCYMLYSGKTFGDGTGGMSARYVIIFDWDGDHVRTLELDTDISAFSVNESNTKLYATTLNEDLEYDIREYDL